MASKPETTYYQSIHRLLPKHLHREKMFNPFSAGTPDVWYSGDVGDLWVEYKWLKVVPKRAPIVVQKMLTPIQRLWLNERHKEGRNVRVILGTPEGSWVYGNQTWDWPMGIPAETLRTLGWTRQQVADFITTETVSSCNSSGSSRGPPKSQD